MFPGVSFGSFHFFGPDNSHSHPGIVLGFSAPTNARSCFCPAEVLLTFEKPPATVHYHQIRFHTAKIPRFNGKLFLSEYVKEVPRRCCFRVSKAPIRLFLC